MGWALLLFPRQERGRLAAWQAGLAELTDEAALWPWISAHVSSRDEPVCDIIFSHPVEVPVAVGPRDGCETRRGTENG